MRGVVPQFAQHHSVCAIKNAFALFLCCAATSPQFIHSFPDLAYIIDTADMWYTECAHELANPSGGIITRRHEFNKGGCPARAAGPSANNIAEVTDLLNRHRAEIDKNFETVATMLNAQNERHEKATQLQRRWNYGLAAALVIVTILAVAALLQR
jgi:hypothetical protein